MLRADLPHLVFDFDFNHLQDSLQDLFRMAVVQQQHQAGFVALHALMLEMNFVPKDSTYENRYDTLPNFYNDAGACKIKYFHASFPDISCQVLAVSMGSILIVHGNISNLHVGAYQTVDVDLDNYICFERRECCVLDPEEIYPKLLQLSEKFKSDFIVPVLYDICKIAGERPFPPFSCLPCDLKLHILSYLPAKNLVAMSQVSKEFQTLANDELLWKNLYKKDFPEHKIIKTMEKSSRWKKLCEEKNWFLKKLYEEDCDFKKLCEEKDCDWKKLCEEKDCDLKKLYEEDCDWKKLYGDRFKKNKAMGINRVLPKGFNWKERFNWDGIPYCMFGAEMFDLFKPVSPNRPRLRSQLLKRKAGFSHSTDDLDSVF